MQRQVIVIGMGRFGTHVATTLHQLRHQVLAIDQQERAVQEIAPFVTEAVQANATDEATLRDLGVSSFDAAVVAVGSDVTTSLLTTVLLKRLGVPFLVARAHSDLHGATLEKVGADKVVYPEQESAVRLAHSLTYPTVTDYLEVSRDYGISKLIPPEHFLNKTLEELGLGQRQDGASVIAIRRSNNQILLSPDRLEKILAGDVLVLAGRDEALERLRLS